MGMFARRQVQSAIDQCGTFMPPAAIAGMVAKLNKSFSGSLPVEWEILLTAAISRLCPVEYEPDLGGTSRADLLVRPDGPGTAGCLVEITAVSDTDAQRQSAQDRIEKEIADILRQHGIAPASMCIQINAAYEGTPGDFKLKPMVGTGNIAEIVDHGFDDFVTRIKADPVIQHAHRCLGPGLDIGLRYYPNGRAPQPSHPLYSDVQSSRRNPVINALQKKKRQIRRTGHSGPSGVVVCDGDCNVLRTKMRGPRSFRVDDLLREYFHRESVFDFIVVLGVVTKPPQILGRSEFHQVVQAQVIVHPEAPPLALRTVQCLDRAVACLPEPRQSAANAVRGYHSKGIRRWRFPGESITMSSNTLRLSSRTLLALLSGHQTAADFAEMWKDNPFSKGNFFDYQRQLGNMIARIELIPSEGDDDEVEFTFAPSASTSPYRPPPSKS